MPPLAQLITDRFLGQQVNLLRLSASERNKVFTMLGTLQARVLAKMDTQIPLPGFATFSQARLAALYRTTDKLMDQAYGAISTLHDTTLIDVSEFQSRQSRKIVNALVGVPLMTVGLPLVNMKALVNDDLVDGRPAAYWWNQQTDTLKAEYRNVIRQGAFAGDTLGQMKQRVQGTKAQNYQNGIMARVGKRAETLIRTSILSVANAARDATFRANDDVLDGQQWHSSLDDRTCEICAALDGQAWDFEGNKMDGTTQDFPGPPPAHFNCRCTTTPVLKSLAQMQRDAGEDDTLGRKLDNIEGDMSPGMRASLEGGVASTTTYDGWLKNQDVATQKDILGPKRYDLFQQGKINVQDLVDQQNRPLTLEDITIQHLLDPIGGGAPGTVMLKYEPGRKANTFGIGKEDPGVLDRTTAETFYQDNGYIPINEQLRREAVTPYVQRYVDTFDAAIEAQKAKDVYVFRGDGAGVSSTLFEEAKAFLPKNFNVSYNDLFNKEKIDGINTLLQNTFKGTTFRDDGFLSTSKSQQLVKDKFLNGSHNITKFGGDGLMHIVGQTKFIDIDAITDIESERLLPRGTTMRVDNVSVKPHPDGERVYLDWRVSIV